MMSTSPVIKNGIPLYSSGDPRTVFKNHDSAEIFKKYGPPRSLLTCSTKIEKCGSVGVLCRVLYMTPGLFCPSSTPACRAGCLGHTSGRMHMPSATKARDQRAAFYIEHQDLFIQKLKDEIGTLRRDALRQNAHPAIRLNGTSDILWEREFPNLFAEFPDIQFYDYTKVRIRMKDFASGMAGKYTWPSNYHLTFSGDGTQFDRSITVLNRGSNVAVVFWPELPESWMGFPVIDGDTHDARFLDPSPVIVGLRAKGIARVDLDGFVVRACPSCSGSEQLALVDCQETTHREALHRCPRCGYEKESRWMLPKSTVGPCGLAKTSTLIEPLQLRMAL